jgi:2-polyprenyl-6-methoxyphenol hydroxylase-like FAD-dependent oxidoreductase
VGSYAGDRLPRLAWFVQPVARVTATTSRQGRSPVLVVGAGPVGLVAAIRLREQGVPVRVVDEQTADGKRTYPVVLHPRTLRILSSLGVSAPLEWRGHTITKLAIYCESERRAVLELPAAGEMSTGAMTLPQDVLRQALMKRLSDLGSEVEWKTKLVSIAQDDARVEAGLVRRELVEGASRGTGVQWLDLETEQLATPFVIGADGCHSNVRRQLGIELVRMGKRQMYVFYDAADQRATDEAQLVVGEAGGNSVYPLQNDVSRFTFQVGVEVTPAPGLAQLQQLLGSRMPWYAKEASHLEWSGNAEFNPALAARLGEGRVWLAGDAAHSTGPLGGQSLNVGMHEAHDLAGRIASRLESPAAVPFGADYTTQRRLEWQRLFGVGPSLPLMPRAPDWVKRNMPNLLPSLPAAGDDLDDLLEQLRVGTA